MGVFFAICTAFSFAIGNIVIKKGISKTNGSNNGYLISVIMNVLLLGLFFLISRISSHSAFHFSWTALLFFMLAGLLTSGLGRFLLFTAIGQINPSRASALKNVAPVFTVLFALIILGEHFTWLEGIGVVLLIGAILLQAAINFKSSTDTDKTAESADRNRVQWLGYFLAVLAAFIFGIGQGIRKQGLFLLNNAFFGAWIGSLTALCFLLVSEIVQGRLRETVRKNKQSFNRYFLLTGIFTSLGPLCFFLGASFIPVSFVSVIAAVEPLLTVLLSSLFLKGEEDLSLSVWVTATLVLAGTIIIVFAA